MTLLDNWTWKFIIAHEVAHALGSAHEQCRSDRDTYVQIQFQNIQAGKEHNFDRMNTENYTAYDFASIMHYGQYAFSKNNLPTIEAQPGYEDQEQYMGNRQYMTALDAAGMAARYGVIVFDRMARIHGSPEKVSEKGKDVRTLVPRKKRKKGS